MATNYFSVFDISTSSSPSLCRTMWRIVKPSLKDPVYLSDILLADILTSCAKILFEFAGIWLLFFRSMIPSELQTRGLETNQLNTPSSDTTTAFNVLSILEPILTALPFLFRFRQCVNEYLNAPTGSSVAARHKANAIKYLSSLPVIFLARFQKMIMIDFLDGDIDSDTKHVVLFYIW